MFTRLRTHVAAFAALIAVACAPSPVLAADPDGRYDLCVATAGTVVEALSIEHDDLVTQQQFIEWFNSRTIEVQVYLSQYLYYGLLMLENNYSLDTIGDEVLAACMERRA